MERIARLETLARAGYAARGIVYLLLGYFALTTSGGVATRGVLGRLADVPAGELLLLVVALGLLGYGVFRLYGGWQDLDGDKGAMGLAKRVGKAASGIAHIFLSVLAVRIALGRNDAGGGMERDAAETAFTFPGGAVAVGVAGALVIAAGLGNVLEAWACSFAKALDPATPSWARYAGRAGYAARGLVLVAIGWQVIALAVGLEDGRLGMESATLMLRDREWLFLLTAAGLTAFGAFSLIMAAYARISDENVIERLTAQARSG